LNKEEAIKVSGDVWSVEKSINLKETLLDMWRLITLIILGLSVVCVESFSKQEKA
jgi:hypothetical protein